jgi:hypothetical protein
VADAAGGCQAELFELSGTNILPDMSEPSNTARKIKKEQGGTSKRMRDFQIG